MHRFFIKNENIIDQQVILGKEEARHLSTVRLSTGDTVELYDGIGNVYQAEVIELKPKVQLAISSRETRLPGKPHLHICQGLLKGKKMDFILQKANELGVTNLTPFYSSFCAVQSPKPGKQARWEKIIMESCKQCGRPLPMRLNTIRDFHMVLAETESLATKIIFWEKESHRRLNDLPSLSASSEIVALIGPEGGFSDEEINQAKKAGFLTVSLGGQTLRAETAALAAMTLLQFLGGKL